MGTNNCNVKKFKINDGGATNTKKKTMGRWRKQSEAVRNGVVQMI